MSCWLPPLPPIFLTYEINTGDRSSCLVGSLPPSLPLIFLTYEINTGDWSSCLVGSLPPSHFFNL